MFYFIQTIIITKITCIKYLVKQTYSFNIYKQIFVKSDLLRFNYRVISIKKNLNRLIIKSLLSNTNTMIGKAYSVSIFIADKIM